MSVNNTNCCVYGCHSRKGKNKELSFHLFPKKHKSSVYITNKLGVKEKADRYQVWMINLNMGKPATKYMRVCSLHFNRNDFILPDIPTKNVRLKSIAVPTQNLPKKSIAAKTIQSTRHLHRKVRSSTYKLRSSINLVPKNNELISTGSMKNLVCRHCSFETQWKFAIEEHTKQHSNIGLEKSYSCSALLNKHKCVQCSFKSITLEKIKQHNIAQHGYTLVKNKSNTDINSENNSKHLKYNKLRNRNLQGRSTKWLNCKDCEYKTKGSSFLYTDKLFKYLANKQINWLKCNNCDYKTKRRDVLKRHQLVGHTPDKQIDWLKCSYCDFKSKTKRDLISHKLHRHTPDEQIDWFKCSDCDYKGKTRIALRSHKLTQHTADEEIEWFKCGDCDYISKTKRNLNAHIYHSHTPDEQIDWFKCSYCDYISKTKRSLKVHIYHRHTPAEQINWFKCSDCDYKGKTSRALGSHKLMQHTADEKMRWFKCDDCDYQTKTRSCLKKHKLHRHTLDEQIEWFKCSNCHYKRKTRKTLERHKIECISKSKIIPKIKNTLKQIKKEHAYCK